ncbi:DUF2783 domain-containing protein [Paracoccaceae bacterium]|nr:DUF2783 domain-containing protein [Paracoccaceae bacterium]
MALNDELYSRLVNLYQDLDDQQIHKLNARLILLLSEKISDSISIKEIIDQVETENKKAKK